MHKLTVGIEHLMTGLQMSVCDLSKPPQAPFVFQRESPSIVAILYPERFQAWWPCKQCWLSSTEVPIGEIGKYTKYSGGEAEWWAQVVAPKMVECETQSYDMQTHTRVYGECGDTKSRYAPSEPHSFPEAVVMAMRRKHGVNSDAMLSRLRWAGTHWFYTEAGMYVGVEPDGYIHT